MEAGVTLADPARIDVRGRLACGRDVFIDVELRVRGQGDARRRRARSAPNCVIARRAHRRRHRDPAVHATSTAPIVGADCAHRPVRAAAPGHRARRGRPHRQLRRDQEQPGSAAHSKANHLAYVGDADGRRARQHRRRHHHLQLRRRQQAPHRDRGRRLHRQRHPAGRAGDGRPRRHARRRHHAHPGCAGRRADRRRASKQIDDRPAGSGPRESQGRARTSTASKDRTHVRNRRRSRAAQHRARS